MKSTWLLAIAVMGSACGAPETEPETVQTDRGAVGRALETAASRAGVPMQVLAARGYQASRFTALGRSGDDHGPQGRGRFGLSAEQLDHAAALAGATAAELEASVELDALGYALLLRETAGGDGLEASLGAAAVLAGVPEGSPAHRGLVRELSALLKDGIDVTLEDGERLQVAPIVITLEQDELGEVSSALVAPGTYPPMTWYPANPNNYVVGRSAPPKYIVIHTTDGSFWSAVSWFQEANPYQASTQYVIRSSDGFIAQMVSETNVAWHAGNDYYSGASVGIEHEGLMANPAPWYTEAMYQSSARLVCAIARRWAIPVDNQHIIGHFQVPDGARIAASSPPGTIAQTTSSPYNYGGISNHYDPGSHGTIWKWDYYLSLVRACVDAAAGNPGPPAPSSGTGQVVCQGAACFATNDLQSGNSGKAVYELQENLVLLGYLTQAKAKASAGVFDAATKTAVAALQAASNLDTSGYFGPKTAAALKAAVLARNLSALTTTDVWSGQTSSQVMTLQRALDALGATLPITGYYGQATGQAVLGFQTRQKVPGGDGTYVGPLTRAALAAALARGQ
jgi:peptidoglycan hydrolase-like protein with peptidoglycan-binding domain